MPGCPFLSETIEFRTQPVLLQPPSASADSYSATSCEYVLLDCIVKQVVMRYCSVTAVKALGGAWPKLLVLGAAKQVRTA